MLAECYPVEVCASTVTSIPEPTTTTTTTTTVPTPIPDPFGGGLPVTGADLAGLVMFGSMLLAAGVALVAGGRR